MTHHTLLAALVLLLASGTLAHAASDDNHATPPPRLIVVISVDQFSADLFAEYRPLWRAGMKRLEQGAVFPSGYQSHAATETCPGHSTILTGDRPARTGIIANTWVDQGATRDDKTVYCAEDERVAESTSKTYTPSAVHLRVPTLGDRLKAANPAARVVAVAGKDRAALMLAGHAPDSIWFLDPFHKRTFVTLSGRNAPPPSAVERANATLERLIGHAASGRKLPRECTARSRDIVLTPQLAVGAGRFARPASDADAFRASPSLDEVTLTLAANLARSMQLGKGPKGNGPMGNGAVTDVLALGLSATDYVGHRYGTEGSEMCIQLLALDVALEKFFRQLDAAHLDYIVVLTADHGGHDFPERNREHALPEDSRLDIGVSIKQIGKQIGSEMHIAGPVLRSADLGDVWLDRSIPAAQRSAVLSRAIALLRGKPQIAAVLAATDLTALPAPVGPPETWTLAERARASFDKDRSGDFVILLKPRVTPIPEPGVGFVATHGSPWDYDRRVPILFWRKGMTAFEQPNSIETVDIAPTLAALVGLKIDQGEMDGRCLDLDASALSTCP